MYYVFTIFFFQGGENVIEDLIVIGEDDSVLAGFTAINKAHDDGTCTLVIIYYTVNDVIKHSSVTIRGL